MNKRDELIVKYANDLREKCNHDSEMALLRKVTIACGPSIYNKDFSTISSTSKSELETVRYNFLIKKLGLSVPDKLEEGISKVIEQYGASNRNKYRTVAYYLLTKHFGKKLMY